MDKIANTIENNLDVEIEETKENVKEIEKEEANVVDKVSIKRIHLNPKVVEKIDDKEVDLGNNTYVS